MAIPEKIYQQVQHMSKPLQSEVLDFVEYLESKNAKHTQKKNNAYWEVFSLANAMRGMEDEESLYSINDIKERFQ